MLSWDILRTEIRVGHPKLCLDRMILMGVESTDMQPPGLVSAASLRAEHCSSPWVPNFMQPISALMGDEENTCMAL